MQEVVEKPWGTYQVLHEGQGFKIKEIVVNEGHKLSLQSHKKRTEFWNILEVGEACIQLGTAYYDGKRCQEGDINSLKTYSLYKGNQHRIWPNQLHRVESIKGTLKFIEIQAGDYLEEDDIIRYSDDYGRT